MMPGNGRGNTAMEVKRDIYEYEAKPGYEILGVEFESNMTNLPKTSNTALLCPIHGYLYTDHHQDKCAVSCDATFDSNEYNATGYYFDSAGSGGNSSSIDNNYGSWRKRRCSRSTTELRALLRTTTGIQWCSGMPMASDLTNSHTST